MSALACPALFVAAPASDPDAAARTLANKPVLTAPDSGDKQDRIAQALARARARRP